MVIHRSLNFNHYELSNTLTRSVIARSFSSSEAIPGHGHPEAAGREDLNLGLISLHEIPRRAVPSSE